MLTLRFHPTLPSRIPGKGEAHNPHFSQPQGDPYVHWGHWAASVCSWGVNKGTYLPKSTRGLLERMVQSKPRLPFKGELPEHVSGQGIAQLWSWGRGFSSSSPLAQENGLEEGGKALSQRWGLETCTSPSVKDRFLCPDAQNSDLSTGLPPSTGNKILEPFPFLASYLWPGWWFAHHSPMVWNLAQGI
jgi:hypothetical protein